MRIVDLETFRSLPDGKTVFCKYDPQVFGELKIKEDSWDCDFIYTDLIGQFDCRGSDELSDLLSDAENTGKEYPFVFDETFRDGLFDEDQLFAIFSEADVKGLAERLLKTLDK